MSSSIEICQLQPPQAEGESSCLKCTHRWSVHGEECLACLYDAQGTRLDVFAGAVTELFMALERGLHSHREFPDFTERTQAAEEHITRAAALLGWQRKTPAPAEVNHPNGPGV